MELQVARQFDSATFVGVREVPTSLGRCRVDPQLSSTSPRSWATPEGVPQDAKWLQIDLLIFP